MSNDFRERLNQALKEAMRAKDQRAISTLRLILAALQDRDIAARGKSPDGRITDDEILQMLQSMVKQREESIAMYEQGGRLELAEQEQAEIDVIRQFLPKQLSESETRDAVDSTIAALDAASLKEMGKVMGELRTRYAGRMDFGKASALVKQSLGR
ncbi:GatB/YqeY domain-containing protein [Marivibrio halodurans]|uniref:GatB/YqeY domain-containing protein n=1 Tax=Marivibrio halodurans TaxID=2039722 RepID=A0A8J7S0S1_9PROT|nr:GatB/YqeY domain-containing protein [Marivibrio halodurans]MBP5856589.1 GatB/YqeY domain-containing protein [Marivibrio halodurans]